jgi:glycine/D-amino acid oxidase-like deaminating enzyme
MTSGRKPFDFMIIGGGSLGLAIAYKLASALPEATVAVVDKGTGSAASRAAGAMLGCFAEVTKYTFGHPASVAKFDMMYSAHRAWPAWREELQSVTGTEVEHRPGSYIILNTQGGPLDDDNFQAVIDALERYNEPFETADPRKIPALEPSGLARPLRAIYLPNEGAVNSHQYLTVLKAACERKGVQFIAATATDPLETTDGLYHFPSEGIAAANLVLAAGAETGVLIERLDLDLSMMPLFSGSGLAMVCRRIAGEGFAQTVRTSNRAGSCGLHLIPLGGGREYIGATNMVYTEPKYETDIEMTEFLTRCAMEQLSTKLFSSRIESWRIGNRPLSLDTLPLIGKTSLTGVYVATGTYRDGFHCSPVIADALLAAVQGKESPVLSAFPPERRPIEIMTKDASIEEHGMQAVSAGYEHWMNAPYYMSDSGVADRAKATARLIYQKLNTDIGLHPDILLCLSSAENDAAPLSNYLRKMGLTNS